MVDLVTQFEITVDGTALTADVNDALVDLRVTKALGVPAYARLSFRAETTGTGLDADTFSLEMGQSLKIEVIDTGRWTAFDGLIVSQGIELDTGTSQYLILECYDKLYTLGRTSVPESFAEQTATDVVSAMIDDAGLRSGTLEALSTVHTVVYQYSTAYAYLDRLVRQVGCEWFIEGDTVQFRKRTAEGSNKVLTVGENLRTFRARYSPVDHAEEVKVTGWDAKRKESIVGTATFDKFAQLSSNDLTAKTMSETVGGKTALSIPRPVADKSDAEQLAESILSRRGAELIRARGEVLSCDITPGQVLEVEGLAGGWSGEYYCTAVEHTFGSGGSMRTFFDVGPSDPESLVDIFAGESGSTLDRVLGSLTIGIVTGNTDDPMNLGRVKVQLPYFSDEDDANWARVLQQGAGKNRGWIVLPEVGDEVLVGFEHGDIDHPFVLGGLHSGKDTPKHRVSELVARGEVQARVFNSRLGHELRFSDGAASADQFIELRTAKDEATLYLGAERIDVKAKQNAIKVFNEKGSIEISKDGDITLKGANIILKSDQDIKIEAGGKLTTKSGMDTAIKAGTNFKAEGSTGANIESPAITVVKGSVVKIN